MRRSDPKESKKRYFRALDRIVCQNGAWYFTAREGDVGPYPTRKAAEREVQRFLLERQQLSKFQRSRSAPAKAKGPAKPVAAKPAAKVAPKHFGSAPATRQTRYHLDQKVSSDDLMLTLDEDFLL